MVQHRHPHPTHKPLGTVTRGTTGVNRLRRIDRWAVHHPEVRRCLTTPVDPPLAIDLGYGAAHWTPVEFARRLRTVRPDLRVLGLEVDPERVLPPRDNVEFRLGGFELAGERPVLLRAFNVLRQYDETEVPAAWKEMTRRLAPGGLLIEGTCDERGRRCAWVLLDATGPRTLTLATDPADITTPSDIAERLPKALIHRNVPGERIHEFFVACDRAWATAAPFTSFGPRERWRRMRALLLDEGVPLVPQRRAPRDGVLTVPWSAVAPRHMLGENG